MGGTMKYAKAPLVLVLAEVRHPPAELPTNSQVTQMKSALSDALPLPENGVVNVMSVPMDASGAPYDHAQEPYRSLRSRDGRTVLSMNRNGFSLETTTYTGWADFRDLLFRVLEQRTAGSQIDGASRVGLRYVDEIRLPGPVGAPPDWREWLDGQAAAPQPDGMGLMVRQQQSVVQYGTDRPDETLTLRYGAVNGLPAVSGPTRPDAPASGPYFLLDIDAAVQPTVVPEFESSWIMSKFDRFHADVSELFESMLTPRLRKEVFDAR